MDRRSFLTGTGTLALSQILAGCGGQNQETLRVKLLKGSVPNSVVKRFSAEIKNSAKLDFASVTQLRTLFENLQSWQQKDEKTEKKQFCIPISLLQGLPFICESTQPPDLLTIGDYWLAAAIEQKLIEPLDVDDATQLRQWSKLQELQQWSKLSDQWLELVRRDAHGFPDANGKIWAAPYRWGYTVIAYNLDKFNSLKLDKPSDWGDLWREELRDRISLPNHPREVIGLTLKTLGKSYNTENLSQVPALEQQLRRLDQQVKFYSSDTYIEPLILGDTWLAVGWSNDVLPVTQRYRHIQVVTPPSGTALWADLWVRPAGVTAYPDLALEWINFCWQSDIAEQISRNAKSPILVRLNPIILNEQIPYNEFLLPLSPEVQQQYQSLWEKIVTSGA